MNQTLVEEHDEMPPTAEVGPDGPNLWVKAEDGTVYRLLEGPGAGPNVTIENGRPREVAERYGLKIVNDVVEDTPAPHDKLPPL